MAVEKSPNDGADVLHARNSLILANQPNDSRKRKFYILCEMCFFLFFNVKSRARDPEYSKHEESRRPFKAVSKKEVFLLW
jgi:hypothetical protein